MAAWRFICNFLRLLDQGCCCFLAKAGPLHVQTRKELRLFQGGYFIIRTMLGPTVVSTFLRKHTDFAISEQSKDFYKGLCVKHCVYIEIDFFHYLQTDGQNAAPIDDISLPQVTAGTWCMRWSRYVGTLNSLSVSQCEQPSWPSHDLN